MFYIEYTVVSTANLAGLLCNLLSLDKNIQTTESTAALSLLLFRLSSITGFYFNPLVNCLLNFIRILEVAV